MKLKNINGTSDNLCSCGSWLNHWQKFSGQSLPAYCPEKDCIETNLVGAHVQKAFSVEDKWYIIPLCKTHNKSSQTIEVLDSINLVPANRSETCGKKLSIEDLLKF